MAERASRKSKRPAPRRAVSRGVGAEPAERPASRVKSLERERDHLKAQLKEAEERIARLEESRTDAVNRIDWVIDSLHNVLENGA